MKFVEEYYRWPKLHRDQSRLLNLGSWAWSFRDASNAAYSKSATHIALDQDGCVLEQHRGEVTRAKTKFVNATLDYLAVATRVYERTRECPDATGARYIALAIAAPGFHRHLRRLQSGFTVVLPGTGSGFEEVVKRIESRPAAKEIFRRFIFLHIVADRLPIVPGLAVFLSYSEAGDQFPKAFVVDPGTVALGAGLWGKAISQLQWVWENVFCIEADIDYSYLTWSMLDPVNGTSERVLDQPQSPGFASTPGKVANPGFVKRRKLATELALARYFHWGAQGRLWLGLKYSGLTSPIFRRAKRRAPRLYEIARRGYRGLRPRGSAALQRSVSLQLLPSRGTRSSYDAIARLNIIDNVAKVTLAFYERLGLSPQQSPVYRCLASMRSKLADEVEALGAISTKCSLERFELAWRAYEAGEIHEALQLFREVIADERLARASAGDPRSREAFIRAAEILGRHAELRGDASAADQLYRRILRFDGNGIVARRLLLMLWRQARIREAAELAPRIMQSDVNLVQHLRGSDAVGELTRRLQREARREPTTARGQNARDFGLQVG